MASNYSGAPRRQGESPYFSSGSNSNRYAPPQQPPPSIRIAEPTTPSHERPPAIPMVARPRPGPNNGAAQASMNRQRSSIGLRRLRAPPSRGTLNSIVEDNRGQSQLPARGQGPSRANDEDDDAVGGRRRSTSEPQRPTWLAEPGQNNNNRNSQHLDAVPEGGETARRVRSGSIGTSGRRPSWLPRLPTRQLPQEKQQQQEAQKAAAAAAASQAEYDSRIVDLLDVVDPEVSTLTSITNLQNSLFIPSLGRFVNRRPTYDISYAPQQQQQQQQQQQVPGAYQESLQEIPEDGQTTAGEDSRPATGRAYSITSNIQDSHYAVLPPGESLDGWSQEEVERLNDHVRHMLHSRRSKFKRGLKGFGRYVRRPLGFLVTLYATLITLFGLAWVLFLIGWIYVGAKQSYLINIIDYTLVALFAIVGDGLAPFRAVDTYHMIYIAHYHRLSWKLRKRLLLPDLRDHNDLPTQAVLPDLEAAHETASIPSLDPQEEFSVLSPKQQDKLTYHQNKYAKSHTFYRPHETTTHFAFPLKLLVAITVLLDLHSCLQISLGACTWGISPDKRPFSLTTIILCCSITSNATAGLLIWIGDRRTRKKDVIERMSRQELTEEAMHKVKKDNEKEAERAAAAKREEEEGKKSLSLPRLSLDKFAGSGTLGKKGESSSQRNSSTFHRQNGVLSEA